MWVVLAHAPRVIYRVAKELGATRIALGHHRDGHPRDVLPQPVLCGAHQGHAAEAGQRRRQSHRDRPLAYVPEHELIRYAQVKQFPIIPATCAARRITCSASRSRP